MSQSLKPTQQTIANKAGVTKATVSLALRNSPLLPESTRKRIREIALKLNYQPNPMVSSLMTYVRASRQPSFKTTVAFVTNFLERDRWMKSRVFADWYHGACERGAQLGYQVEHVWLREAGMGPKEASRILWNRGMRGLIFAPMASAQEVMDLDFSKFSSVAIGYTLRKPGLVCVSSNHIQNMLLALKKLKQMGYRHLGVAITAMQHERTDYGWLTALETARYMGCGPDQVSIFGLNEWGKSEFEGWLKKYKPEVVISASDDVWSWLQRLKIRIPKELGYVDLNCADHKDSVSGIDQNTHQSGMTAMDLVSAQIERNECGVPTHAQVVLIEGDWARGTTLRKVR